MKKLISIFLMTLCVHIFPASGKVIENPPYSFKTTALYNILKVELNKGDTQVINHVTFLPHWWVDFTEQTFIEDSGTGKRYYITGMENGTIGEQIYMPASGDSTFVLVFPPLDKEVKQINIGEGENTYIYGIDISGKPKKDAAAKKDDAGIYAWIDEQVKASGGYKMLDPESADYLKHGTGKIVGYIKGYDPRAGFTTAMIYTANDITREDLTMAVEIEPDGRFMADVPLQHPRIQHMVFDRVAVPVYLEQGATLGVILDWQDFLDADRLRDRRYKFTRTEYRGPLAEVNTEIVLFDLKEIDYGEIQKMVQQSMIYEFADKQMEIFNENMAALDGMLADGKVSKDSYDILKLRAYSDFGTKMFDAAMMRAMYTDPGTYLEPMAPEYYGFLKAMPLNDPQLLAMGDAGIFLNRFEYMDILDANHLRNQIAIEVDFFEYLTSDESNSVFNEKDNEFLKLNKSLSDPNVEDRDGIIAKLNTMGEEFFSRHKDEYEVWTKKYLGPYNEKMKEMDVRIDKYRDSVIYEVLGVQPNLMYDITKVRLINNKTIFEKEGVRRYVDRITGEADNRFVKSEAWRLFNKLFPEGGKQPYKLDDSWVANRFRELIEPFKGKLILVDFWATWCSPCMSGIKSGKERRKQHEENGDMVYLFITDNTSPLNTYEQVVEEQELVNTHRVSNDDYRHFRSLFKFNGIPHYVLVDKNGDIIDDNYNVYNNNLSADIEKYK